jgi:hypothetical protein
MHRQNEVCKLILLLPVLLMACTRNREAEPGPMRQNPSPMVESTREHGRIEDRELPGVRFAIDGILAKPVEVYVPEKAREAADLKLLVHFHGAAFVPMYAVNVSKTPFAVAAVHLGVGSGVYERAFADDAVFERLLSAVGNSIREKTGRDVDLGNVTISSFSAGYGAVRAILRDDEALGVIAGVLLLDGLHTDYVPEGRPLAEGGRVDEDDLEPFLRFAELAIQGQKRFLITHSEIFPGTYASTTETADYLIQALGLKRTAVLEWGPLGMQQLSEVRQGRFAVLGFAGNTGPDHIDHFHGLYQFLEMLIQ